MLSYVLRKIQSDTLGVGGATIFEVKSVNIIPSLPYIQSYSCEILFPLSVLSVAFTQVAY
jgi:hypothetical protein